MTDRQWRPDPRLRLLTAPQLLAVLLYGEARGESLLGQLAVASVVRNRVALLQSSPTPWHDVMLRPWAFSCFDDDGGVENAKATLAFAIRLLEREAPTRLERQLQWLAEGVVDGHVVNDPTVGSTHYFVRGTRVPKWALGQPIRVSIGDHDFYRVDL